MPAPHVPVVQEAEWSVPAPLAPVASKRKIPKPIRQISPAVVQHDKIRLRLSRHEDRVGHVCEGDACEECKDMPPSFHTTT